MFNKFKTKPTLKSVSNAIKTVGQKDLSDDVSSRAFVLDDLARYGVNGLIVGMAFDPVQSLLAFSTTSNEIRVYGQRQVEVVFSLNTFSPIITLKFIKGVYLIAVDSKSTILVFSLHSKKLLSSYSTPGKITAVESDPSLDWLLIGLQNGVVYFYDIDRGCLAPFRIDNLQKEVLAYQRMSPVISIKWHPRHIGTILLTYNNCALIYSISTGEIKQKFVYDLPAGALGAEEYGDVNSKRYPEFVNAIWHPNGLHIVSIHVDNSIVFWDVNDGTLIQARSLTDTSINLPSRSQPPMFTATPIIKTAWTCGENPENTQLLFAGGDGAEESGIHTLTMLDFGTTLSYSITSHEKNSQFYSNARQQKVFPVPSESPIIDFLPLPRKTPYFAGSHDPSQIIVLLENGEIHLLDYPSGRFNFDASRLPPNISFIHPKTTVISAVPVRRIQLLGMLASVKSNTLLRGGLPAKKPQRVFDTKTLIITGHDNGSIRMWDSSKTELDENAVLQADISIIIGHQSNSSITHISFSGETTELVASTISGNVVFLKYGINPTYDSSHLNDSFSKLSLNGNQQLIDLKSRGSRIKEGFLPIVCLKPNNGQITSLENSDVGFVAIGYENGQVIVVDMRGPAIIFNENIAAFNDFSRYTTSFKFGIMEIENEGYSSIVLFAGTDRGQLLIFKIIPNPNGRFSVQFYDSVDTNEGSVKSIIPFNLETGSSAEAKIGEMKKLGAGIIVPGAIIVSSEKDIRIIKPVKSKISHRSFSAPTNELLTVGICGAPKRSGSSYGIVLTVLLSSGDIKILSVPELREISSLRVPYSSLLEPKFAQQSNVLPSGDLMIRINENEAGLLSVLGKGISLNSFPTDTLFNDRMFIPYRPVVNALQWARGTKIISTGDLNFLLAGPNRPKPKNPESELAYNISPEAGNANTSNNSKQSTYVGEEDYSYKKPVRAHTPAGLGVNPLRTVVRSVQNGIETIEETANGYANNVSENMSEGVSDARNSLLKSAFKSKFGF